ncbi:MAG: helix-turn-helix domain-containing protein [Alphaproteobacteria bacterium]|nr:helix-turn-helix domain-containing protein [Alphaproteobacteria bacterium]
MGEGLPDRASRIARHRRSRLQSSLFRTDTLLPSERFGAWRESMRVFLDSSLSVHEQADQFVGEVEGYLIDDILLTRGMASRQKYDRAAPKIARDSLDHYMVQIFLGGHTQVALGRRSVRSIDNHPIAFDLGDILDSYNSDFDLVCVVIPRTRLAPLLLRPDSVQAQIPDTRTGAGALLAGYMRNLYLMAPSLTPPEAANAARALLELVASALNGAHPNDTAAHAANQALLLKAQRMVRENLASPALTPEAIALAVGMSRSALYELFQPVGGVANYVREMRLRRCLGEIMSARHAHEQVSEIAYRWGFTNAAHFTRAFKTRFGRTPSDARESARALGPGERVALDARVGDRRYEEWIATLA